MVTQVDKGKYFLLYGFHLAEVTDLSVPLLGKEYSDMNFCVGLIGVVNSRGLINVEQVQVSGDEFGLTCAVVLF